MNKLLKTIEENNIKVFESAQDNFKEMLTENRIKELEALVEMIENEKIVLSVFIRDELLIKTSYNQAITNITQELKIIIKYLKTN